MTRYREWADRLVYRTTLWVGGHWLETAGLLLAVAVVGAILVAWGGGGWNGIGVFETCYGVVLAVGIFTWTLAGFATREVERRTRGAEEFARRVETGESWGVGPLDPWHREELATALGISGDAVEDQLVVWLIDKRGAQGAREALVITRRLWYLRLVGRGRGGRQVLDLATDSRFVGRMRRPSGGGD